MGENKTIGGDWRVRGMRLGVMSVMAATGMVLAGQAAEAATTATPALKAHADGGGQGHTNGAGQSPPNRAGQGLPLHLSRLAGGNSGASCIAGGDPNFWTCLGGSISNNAGSTGLPSSCQGSSEQ